MGNRGHISEEILSAYADGETSTVETDAIRRHLLTCADCGEIVDRFQSIDDAVAAPTSLPCEALLPLLSADFDGELDADLAAPVREHAASCSSCRAARDAWTKVDERVSALGEALPSRRVDDAIAAVATRTAPRVRRPVFAGSLAFRLATALLVIAVTFSGSVLLTRAPEQALAPGEVIVASMQVAVLDARTNTLYVVDANAGAVIARDATTDATITQVRVGGRPTAIALDEGRNAVFVLDSSAKTLTQIDTTTHAIVHTDTLAISGTPTSLSVDVSKAKVVVAATSPTESGQVAVIDAGSRQVEAVRTVDVQPSLVTIDSSANLAFVLGADSTLVLDTTTYDTVATLPGNGVGAASNRGVTALLTRRGADARVYFNGAAAGPLDLAGAPLAIAPGPRGTFAALLDVRGKAHVVLIDASGIVGDGDVDANARQLAYDASAGNLVVLGAKGEGLGTLKGAEALAVRATPAPQTPAPSANPTASPSAAPSPTRTPSATPIPTPRPTPPAAIPGYEVPAAARPLWPGTLYLDEPDLASISAFTGSGSTLWFVAGSGGVYSLDVRSGARTLVTTLPDGARVSFVSVGGGFLYALDTGAQTLYAIDLVTREVRPHYMAFGKSIVAMDIAVDGRLWFASSALGQLVSFDPRTERYDFVNRSGAKRLSAIYAQVLNKIWFAYPHGKDAVVGVYDTRWGVVDERTIDAGGDVTALFVDGNGTVWASSSTLGLISISGEALARVGSGPATNLGFALGADGSGWALQSDARGGRLGRLGGTSMPFPTTARGLFVDSYGRLWTADTANSGFYLVIAVTAP